MADREIRIRGAKTEEAREAALNCIGQYEAEYMARCEGGWRNGTAFWLTHQRGCVVNVCHTKTAIVGVYQEAANG